MQRFLHRSVARDTVRKHVLSLRAGAGRFGLFSAVFVTRISTPDKAGGLVRPGPPALHRLAGGQFGPDGKCLFCQPSLANAKVELAELLGTVFGPPCWAPRCEETFAEAQQWGRFSGSIFGACVWKASGLRGLKSRDFCNQIYFVTDCWFLCQAPHVTRTRSCGFRHTQLFNACCWRVVEICSAAAA